MKAVIFALLPLPALADYPVVKSVEINGSTVSVTLEHPDTGWDHYADGWEVLTPDGTSLGLRVLAHPHVDEQPFTRSLSGVDVPVGLSELHIRARCSQDGWSDHMHVLTLD